MNEEKKDRAAFTLADIRALRLLALGLGVIFALMAVVIQHQAELIVAGGLMLVIMLGCPLAIYLRRRHQGRKDVARAERETRVQHTSPDE